MISEEQDRFAKERRDALDRMAWDILDRSPSHPVPLVKRGGRPWNFREMAESVARNGFEHAWSDFLHAFFYFKSARLFEFSPPVDAFPRGWLQVLAGSAEWLSRRYSLPVPAWVDHPDYFLDELWDPSDELCPDSPVFRAYRISRTPDEFLRRNVVFESRNLITL